MRSTPRSVIGQLLPGVNAMIYTNPEHPEHLSILCHVIDCVHGVHRSHQTLLYTFLRLWVVMRLASASLRRPSEVAQHSWPMSENDGMPIGKVQYVPLPLKDWDEKRGAELFGGKKGSQVTPPLTQVFRNPLG